jgi:hypothetical protein
LSLRHVELGSFAVPREWTDWAPLDAQAAPTGDQPLLIDAFALSALSELVTLLTRNGGLDRWLKFWIYRTIIWFCPMNIQDSSSAALRKRRHHLAHRLPPIEQILRGSLIETYKRCGRPNCHCVDGTGHGPKRYLSTISRTGERPRVGYVPNAAHAEVCEFLANFRKLREMLNEVCTINAELLRRRESLD